MAALLAAVLLVLTSVHTEQAATPVPGTPPTKGTIFAVGDIVQRGLEPRAEAVGQLMKKMLDETPGSIALLLGDNSNDAGSPEDFDRLDKTVWGELRSRYRERVFAAIGNHEYWFDKTNPFHFFYWFNPGPIARGYDWFDLAGWRFFRLNSELMKRSHDQLERTRRREMLEWFEQELRRVPGSMCTGAYFHRPPFSSGNHASPAWVMPLFHLSFKYGLDWYGTGHELT